MTISTRDSAISDSTVSFSAVGCVVFHAKNCHNGAVTLTTTTSSYTTDVYALYLRGPIRSEFGGQIYATYVALEECGNDFYCSHSLTFP